MELVRLKRRPRRGCTNTFIISNYANIRENLTTPDGSPEIDDLVLFILAPSARSHPRGFVASVRGAMETIFVPIGLRSALQIWLAPVAVRRPQRLVGDADSFCNSSQDSSFFRNTHSHPMGAIRGTLEFPYLRCSATSEKRRPRYRALLHRP